MAKLQKIETDYRFYEYVLSPEELKLYLEDEDRFWDEIGYDIEWEFVRDKQGGDDIEFYE